MQAVPARHSGGLPFRGSGLGLRLRLSLSDLRNGRPPGMADRNHASSLLFSVRDRQICMTGDIFRPHPNCNPININFNPNHNHAGHMFG